MLVVVGQEEIKTQNGKNNESYSTVNIITNERSAAQRQSPLLRILTFWKETIKRAAITYDANFTITVSYASATTEE